MFHIQNIFRGYCWVPSVGVYCCWALCPSGVLHFSPALHTHAQSHLRRLEQVAQGECSGSFQKIFRFLPCLWRQRNHMWSVKRFSCCYLKHILVLLKTHFIPQIVEDMYSFPLCIGAMNSCGFTLKQKSWLIFLIVQLLFHFWASSDFSYLSIKSIMTGSSCHHDTLYG